MRYGVLGPFEVAGVDGPIRIGGPKEQALLAALLVRANETVSVAQLAEDLWGDAPPRTAAKTIQAYVSRIRRAAPGARIVTAGAGYRLDVEPDDVDATRFGRLAFEGRRALDDGDPPTAAALLDDALALWRGEPLSEFDDAPFAQAEATRLNELRLAVVEDRVAAGLASGEGNRLVSELQRLVRAYPLRERLWGQLMVALYQSGRQADALSTFQTARRYLVDEMGLEPGEELRNLERLVLDQDSSLRAPAPPRRDSTTVTVTVLLTDIEASTRLWESNAAAMAAAVADHEALVRAAVQAHGGELLKTRGEGDSTFSVFQRASEAVAAAIAMQRSIIEHPWPTPQPVRVRAAVHTGEVESRDDDYFGRAINRAARLRALGTGGQVLLSATTAGLVADAIPNGVELVDLGSHELRDLVRPEHVYALWAPDLGERPTPARRAGAASSPIAALRTGPLVGRSHESARLRHAWESASTDRLGLVLVSGEPGVGKTRLVAELADTAAGNGAIVLYGRCDDPPLSPYQPFVEMVQQLASSPVGGLRDAVTSAPELAALVPELGRRFPGVSGEYIPAVSDRYRLFEAVSNLVLGQSVPQPLLVVIDDLHWADDATLQLLRHLLRAKTTGRALVVATFRDTELGRTHPLAAGLGDLARDAPVERIELRGLDREAVRAVIGADNEAHADEVWRVTNGNPFFVVEIGRYLGEAHDELFVPQSVKHVVGQRVARLGRDADAFLSAGAVVGLEFELDVAAGVAGLDDDGALDAADAASAAGLLRAVDGDRYVFAHALVRQTLIDELTPSRRIRAHRRVAQAVERVHADDLDPWFGALAHHWAAGGDSAVDGPGYRYSMLAGDRAASLLAWEEARSHYERAVELAQASGDVRGQVCALTELGETRLITGDIDAADEVLMTAIDLARERGDGELFARAVLSYGTFPRNLAGLGPVADLLEEAHERVGDANTPLRVQILGRRAFSRLFLGPDGAALAREAYAEAQEVGDPLAIVMAANAMRFVGPDAFDHEEVARRARELLGTKWAIWGLFAESWEASPLFNRGDVRGALEAWDRAVERMRGGFPLVDGQRRLFDALIAGLEGRFDEAERIASEAADQLTYAGETNVLLIAGTVISAVRRMRGRVADDVPVLEMMRFARPNVTQARLVLAYAKSDPARVETARQELRELADTGFAAFRSDWLGLFSLGFLARAAADLGERAVAAPLYELLEPRSGELLTLHGFLDCLGAVDHHLGLLALLDGRVELAATHLRAALAFHERLGWRPLVSETELWLARALKDTDPSEARRLASSALSTANDLGITQAVTDARALLQDIGRGPLPAALTVDTPLVGRDDELDGLTRWLEEGPRLALVSGEPGIGKTRLVGELAARAYGSRWAVLYGACDEDGQVPFQPFVMAMKRAPQPADHGVDPETERYRWFEAVEQALREAGPAVLVIDDLHWADGGSLALLKHVLRADGLDGLRVLAAYRDTDIERARPLGQFLAELWGDTAPLRVDLRGLTQQQVGQLLPEGTDAAAVHDETEGNPLFVRLVARHLEDGGRGIPQGIRDVVGRRLDRLADDSVQFLRVAALAGREFDLADIAAATETPETAALEAVEDAVAVGLIDEAPGVVDRFVFTHALIAATLAGELTTSRRVRVHRRLAEVLEARSGDVAAIARHYCEGAVTGVGDKAVRYASDAAEAALASGSWEEAARWRATALDALETTEDDPHVRGWLELRLGEALIPCGEAIEARVHLDRAAALARKHDDAELLARAALAYVGDAIKTSTQESGEDERLDEALAALGSSDSRLRGQLLARKARWNAYIGDRRLVTAWADEAYLLAKDADDGESFTYALGVKAMLALGSGDPLAESLGQDGIAFARRSGDRALEASALGFLVASAIRSGDISLARERFVLLKEAATAAKAPRARWAVDAFQGGLLETIAGDWQAAERSAEAALALAQGTSANPFLPLGTYMSQLIPIRWLQGRLGELADQFKWAADTSTGPLIWHSAAAMALVHASRFDEARQVLAPIAALSQEEFLESVESGAMVCHLAQVCGPLRERDLAARTYDSIRDRDDVACLFLVYLFLGVYEHHRGMLAAAAGWPEVARAHLERAIQQYEQMEAPAWADRARADLAALT